MKKLYVVLLALFMAFTLQNGAFADDNDKASIYDDSGNEVWKVDQNGEMAHKVLNELFTTNDTLTAVESGGKFAVDAASTSVSITLPAAAAGLNYEITGADTTAFYVVPNSTDTIKLLTLAAGDSVSSSGAVGDSIKLFATTTGTWYASVDGGTFVDRDSYGD